MQVEQLARYQGGASGKAAESRTLIGPNFWTYRSHPGCGGKIGPKQSKRQLWTEADHAFTTTEMH
jgi:hypothetical protein